MPSIRSCSWCHEFNDTAEEFCHHCGHMAHVPRALCTCPQCRPRDFAGDIPLTPEQGRARDMTLAAWAADGLDRKFTSGEGDDHGAIHSRRGA